MSAPNKPGKQIDAREAAARDLQRAFDEFADRVNRRVNRQLKFSRRLKATTPLTYDAAMTAMRKPEARLVRMHGGQQAVYYVVPGGAVERPVADKIIAHPLVRGGRDGLFPGHDQTWRMIGGHQWGEP
jgi:hypothetical protein